MRTESNISGGGSNCRDSVIVVDERISLLETAIVEGAATLECMIIVLYMGRFSPLKERVGLTVDDAPLSTD